MYGMSAVAIAGSAYAPNPVIAYLLLCVTGLFIYAGNPLFWSLASSFRTGAAGAATIALINTIAQFGGLVGPWSIGLVRSATGNFKLALLTIAAFLVIATIIALVMRVKPAEDEVASLPPPIRPHALNASHTNRHGNHAHDHRLPRPLHDLAAAARSLAQAADRRKGRRLRRRRGLPSATTRSARASKAAKSAAARARHRSHDLLAARRRHGAITSAPPAPTRAGRAIATT